MEKSLIIRINERIDKLLSYPGCDEKTLSIRKTLWIYNFLAIFYIVFIVTVKLIYQPQALVTIYYCYYLIFEFSLSAVILPNLKRNFNLYFIINTIFEILVTAFVILKQGGIATSYNYLIVNFTFVLLTIPLKNLRVTIGFFGLYVVSTIIVAIIGPAMKVPDEILLTPVWNDRVSITNTIVVTALALILVATFIKKQQELEQMEAIRQKEMNEAKTRLFTNITHEFRTPLTVIGGMADLVEQKPELWIPDGTKKIKANSNLMLRLVNQLLDISKIEAKAMPVHKIKGDIARYVGFIIELHRSAAIEKNISLNFRCNKKPVIMDFDPDMISQILSNLLGNAIKFTSQNGVVEIKININETENLFMLQVIDSGKGIPEDKIQYVFDRFYQVENHANSGGGTGLGLALTKELTMLMNGDITVESQPGLGSVFTVQLPVTRMAEPGEYFLKSYYKKEARPAVDYKTTVIKPKEKIKTDLPILLIVEDSKDVSLYLSAILCDEYQIELATNGKTGLEKALEKIPDIIVSDIMMPEMDGIEMLDKLKTDFRTSHIPVVMLTAKADIDSRLEGLERGADAYITKPFNETELHIQLKNLIELRKKLHERYSSMNHFPESHDPALKTEDKFVGKVRELLEKNLDNDEFNINNLCRELAVGHTQLYRKFKSISNLTIADYFKLLRLNKAKELFSDSELNITQIAFAVGFKNLSHFSREFARQFGKSPKEFRKSVFPGLQLSTHN
jgi:signal transduction histidine kinase/DNA-binding response OmpR family regulator